MSSQIGVKYGGEDIPGSPFEMTSNADTSDVIGDGSRKSSGEVTTKYLNNLWLVTSQPITIHKLSSGSMSQKMLSPEVPLFLNCFACHLQQESV